MQEEAMKQRRIEQLEERMRGADALVVLWETRATRAEALVKQRDAEVEMTQRCITMAMGCLDPHSKNPDERLAWYRLLDALDGKEPRAALAPEQEK
jgi:hypothetical protein